MKMNAKLTHHSIKLTLCIAAIMPLSGCAPSHFPDSRYAALSASAESNPAPEAIVGMWHRRDQSGNTNSFFFKPDGTGYSKAKIVFEGYGDSPLAEFKYWYTGGGAWMNSNSVRFRLANGSLLVNWVVAPTGLDPGHIIETVYERVPQG